MQNSGELEKYKLTSENTSVNDLFCYIFCIQSVLQYEGLDVLIIVLIDVSYVLKCTA